MAIKYDKILGQLREYDSGVVGPTGPTGPAGGPTGPTGWTGPAGTGTGDVNGPASATDNALVRFDATTGKLVQNGIITESDNGDLANPNSIEMDITPTSIPNSEGVMSWNSVDKTLDINQGNDVVQQVWQEQFWRGKNQTGATISNASVVYANGALGASGIMTIAKYTANGSISGMYVLWVATEDITNGNDGFITTFGKVRNINTTWSSVSETWVDGDVLYANPSVAGAFTKVMPTYPNVRLPIAFVIHAATNWTIAVRVPTPDQTATETGYSNSTSLLTATNVQMAVDELVTKKADNSFVTIAVSGQSNVVADSPSDTLTMVAGSGMVITTNASTDTITLSTVSAVLVTKTADYTASTTTEVILCDATLGPITISLPAASGNSGLQKTIKKTDSTATSVTIDANASETIDGSLTKVIVTQNESFTIICNGSNWFII